EEGFSVRLKDVGNLVSDADLEAERAIAAVIHRTFPDHAILGEELHEGGVNAEHLWVVDPLDGTNNFVHHIPHFAVSVAYYHLGRAECGLVFQPLTGELFRAQRGEGATRNGRTARVGPEIRLEDVLIGVGFFYDRGAMMEATLSA